MCLMTWRALCIITYRKGSAIGPGGTGCESCDENGDVVAARAYARTLFGLT
jgi:hypothetical protein